MNHLNWRTFTAAFALAGVALAGCSSSGGGGEPPVKAAKLLTEHNGTDEDTGFQGFADGRPWNEMTLTGPEGTGVATVTAGGGLFDFGLTELFFETQEPPNDEVSIETVLARLPAGGYVYAADSADGGSGTRATAFSHTIPAVPEVTPTDGTLGVDAANTIISWMPVTTDLDDNPVTIVGYQVIVQPRDGEDFPDSFAAEKFSVYLSAASSSVTVPAEFMADDSCYEYEVLAIETSGNQTIAVAEFGTGTAVCTPVEEPEEDPGLKVAKILIEHNATDLDTGFQGFADGDPWTELTISGPGAVEVVRVTPQGGLGDFGFTEVFFETNEPPNADEPIAEVLARMPAGTYTFRAILADGGTESILEGTLSHAIPNGVTLLSPVEGAEDVDPGNTVVSWNPVTTDLDGDPITIDGYQVIVVDADREDDFPGTFAQPELSIHLPPGVTSVTIPAEFMRAGAEYEFEVLAIADNGNQTLASSEFETE